MEKEWKILKKESVFESPWRGMDKYRVQLPNGKEDDFFMTVTDDAVMIFALTKDNTVVVIQQYHFYYQKRMLELPAGFIENGDVLETARVELMEETGCAAREFIPLGATYVERWRVGKMHYVLALGAEQVAAQQLEDSEDINVAFMELSEFRALLDQRAIENGPTITGAYMALGYLGKL